MGFQAISSFLSLHDQCFEKFQIRIMIKIDVGLHRCGVNENSDELIAIVKEIDKNENMQFHGILSHAGHSYGSKNITDVIRIAREENDILNRVKNRIEDNGIIVSEISVGATPTVLCCKEYDNITEIRPGNYVFMDKTPLRYFNIYNIIQSNH